MDVFDAVIIGAGQAGGPLATTLAGAGWKTALIEKEHVGGTCVNEGCTPTKTMVASARAAYLARRGADYGVQSGHVTTDMKKVRQRKRDIVESFRKGSQRRIDNSDVEFVKGTAAFTGQKTIEVQLNGGGDRQITAERIFINTGAEPRIPDIPGLDDVNYLDSTSIMELDHVPDHLLIIGGGYVGLEFGQMFRRFGSQVTIVEQSDQLVSQEDKDIAEAILDILREDCLQVILNAKATQVGSQNGKIQIELDTPDGKKIINGSHMLIAAGRIPSIQGLNLSATGVETDSLGNIKVNERLETNVDGIYALGDVNGGPAFTHISYDDFRIIKNNLLGGEQATVKDRLVPYTIFIDPQLGRIGLNEKQARQKGINYKVAKMPMNHVARALEVDEARGFMKALVDPESSQILGCAVLGIEGGELMAILEVAMLGKLPYTVLRDAVFTHPTLAEGFNTLFASFEE